MGHKPTLSLATIHERRRPKGGGRGAPKEMLGDGGEGPYFKQRRRLFSTPKYYEMIELLHFLTDDFGKFTRGDFLISKYSSNFDISK